MALLNARNELRRSLLWSALLVALALVAAACGGGDDDDSAATATAVPAVSAAESDDAPTPEPDPTAAPEPTATTEQEPTAEPEPTPEPAPTAEPEPEPELSSAELAQGVVDADSIPLPGATELTSYETDGEVQTIGGIVDGPPPPGLAGILGDAGWEVLLQEFGSEWAAGFRDDVCLLIYANYEDAAASEYWIYVAIEHGITPEECSARFPAFRSTFEGVGAPR